MEFFLKLIMIVIGINFYGVNIPIVVSGDGLYKDKYEEERYVYKGTNPNNYIIFNDELWRILSFDNNGVRLIRDEVLVDMAFDNNGANKWESSSLNKFLNNDYSIGIEDNYRGMIKSIGLISLEEFLDVNSNQLLCGNLNSYFKNEKACYKSNYINSIAASNINNIIWTSTADDDTNGIYYVGNIYFPDISPSYSEVGVLPVIHLSSDIKLHGKGTLHNPFEVSF